MITDKTFGPTETVHANNRSFYRCIFDDCEIIGETGMSFESCEFKGRAAKWFEMMIEPSVYMTVDLQKGGVVFGPAASTKH